MKLRQLHLLEDLRLLIEASKEEMLVQNQGDAIWNAYRKDVDPRGVAITADEASNQSSSEWNRRILRYNDAGEVVDELAKINRKYLQWIVNVYIKGEFKLEDAHQIKLDLDEFNRVKTQLDKKDINQYKTLQELYAALEPFKEKEAVSGKEQGRRDKQRFIDSGAAEIFYKDDTITVVIPKTPQAAIFFGKNTKWCTTWSDPKDRTQPSSENLFRSYNRVSRLYIISTNKGKKYQFYFGGKSSSSQYDEEAMKSAEFQNELNRELNPEQLAALIRTYPSIGKVFNKLAKKNSVWPLVSNPTEDDFKAMIDEYKYDSEREDYGNVAYHSYDFDAMKYLMNHNPSDKILDYAIEHGDDESFKYMDEKYQTDRRIKLALKVNPFNVRYLKKYTEEYGMMAIEGHPRTLREIPREKQTYRMAKRALERAKEWDEENNGRYGKTLLLHEVNPRLLKKHPDLIMMALKSYGDNLNGFPTEGITSDMAEVAFKSDPHAIKAIPPKFQTKEMAKVIIFGNRRGGTYMHYLKHVDPSLYTEDDMVKAVIDEEYGIQRLRALKWDRTPDNQSTQAKQTMKIAKAAVEAHGVARVFDELNDVIAQKILGEYSKERGPNPRK